MKLPWNWSLMVCSAMRQGYDYLSRQEWQVSTPLVLFLHYLHSLSSKLTSSGYNARPGTFAGTVTPLVHVGEGCSRNMKVARLLFIELAVKVEKMWVKKGAKDA